MPALSASPIALALRIFVLIVAVLLGLKHLAIYPASEAGADWIGLAAPVFYLWAFWSGAEVFSKSRDAAGFGPALLSGLNQMGAGLMLGAWVAILAEPALRHLVQNGFTVMTGVRFDLTLANLVLAFAGLTLILLARRGRQIRAELDGFV
ncbi:hypothetical protein [Hyphobacterium indicum]|uniref:hypothetical protein n=1 Tax=Hyphobacterium indicum TaxID=2162714 RepID=UPI000D64BBEA|nr:hypothetical protein [Hyphobacterium indicum]